MFIAGQHGKNPGRTYSCNRCYLAADVKCFRRRCSKSRENTPEQVCFCHIKGCDRTSENWPVDQGKNTPEEDETGIKHWTCEKYKQAIYYTAKKALEATVAAPAPPPRQCCNEACGTTNATGWYRENDHYLTPEEEEEEEEEDGGTYYMCRNC